MTMTRTLKVGDLFRCAALAEHITDVTRDADPARGQAVFRVTAAQMDGGGRGHSLGDNYPDGWHVTAKRIGGVDESVRFYQTGCFHSMLPAESIEQVGEMPADVGLHFGGLTNDCTGDLRPVTAPLESGTERRMWIVAAAPALQQDIDDV